MKKLSITLLALFISAVNLAQEKLDVNTSKSSIKWNGEYAFYFGGHNGVINLKQGHFIKTKGKITGGEFIIDMTSIKSLDIDDEKGRASLDKHLKDKDFFEVNKFPIAKLVFTDVIYETNNELKIYANLTIKEITSSINFRAEINFEKEEMTTKFKIDRTIWGVTYNSKEIEGKLKDGLISDAIGFEVKLNL
jgi:polyisoprenoid-binding protein YceI